MKKFLKSLLAASLGLVAVVGFASCEKTPTPLPTEKTETPAPQFDCANGVHDAATEWSSDNTKHWHACSLCDKLVDKEAHKWGEWTVTKEATLTEKGSRWHECSVCGKKLEEEIPMLKPESVVAAEDVAIYVKAPEGWAAVNCYWWYKGEDGTEYGSTTWPGEAMTQVDAENNIWGFVYPKGANRVIFNSDGVQTVDLEFKSTNYYILQAEATDKFDVEQYTTYTPAADQPELNKYTTAMPTGPVEVEMTTIYAQLPEAWTGHYIYYWGSQGAACPAWPGTELTVVDAAKHLYSAEVPADLGGFCLSAGVDAEGNTIDQTGDLALVEGVNAYIVQPVDGKDTAKLANYKDGVLTEIVVAIPLPDMNIKGSMNGWADNDAYKFTYDATTDSATFELTVAPGDAFKVAAVGAWSPQFNSQNSTLADGLKAGEGNDLENIVVEKGGKYLITISGCKDSATATCVFTVVEHQQIIVPVPDMYIAGSHNGWGDAFKNEANKLVVDAEADKASLEVYLAANTEFKVTDSSWGLQYGFGATGLTYAQGLFTDQGGNLKVVESGIYTIVVSNLEDKTLAQCSISKNEVAYVVKTYTPTAIEAPAQGNPELGIITTAGELNTLGEWRLFIVVDAEGRIAYMCEFPKNGYGNPASDSYVRHSAYSDYKTNPAFKDLGSEPYDEWGNVEYKVVIPEGGFALVCHTSHAELIELLTGITYAEHAANKQSINVDAYRLSQKAKDGVITLSVSKFVPYKEVSLAEAAQLPDGYPVILKGEVSVASDTAQLTDGTNTLNAYKLPVHACVGDEIHVYGVIGTNNNVKQIKSMSLISHVQGEEAKAAPSYKLEVVTEVSQLTDGAKVVITYKEFVMGVQQGDYRCSVPTVGTSIADNCIQVVTLVKSGDNWLLQVAEGQYLASSGAKKLNVVSDVDSKAQWTIAIADGVTTIVNVANTELYLQYNVSSPRFTTYKLSSKQNNVTLQLVSEPAYFPATLYSPTENDAQGEVDRGTVWKDIFTLGSSADITKKWKISSNKKTIYNLDGEILEVTHRLQSAGKNDMTIDLSDYEGYVKVYFYALTGDNGDLTRKFTILDGEEEVVSFTCDVTSDSLPSDTWPLKTPEYTVVLECGKAYTLTTSGAINFHAIKVVPTDAPAA